MRGTWYVYRSADESADELNIVGPTIHGEIPLEVFDELVVMRYAQLEAEGHLAAIEERATENNQGNFGCDALLAKQGRTTALDYVKAASRSAKRPNDE